jgi:hypothetical protein
MQRARRRRPHHVPSYRLVLFATLALRSEWQQGSPTGHRDEVSPFHIDAPALGLNSSQGGTQYGRMTEAITPAAVKARMTTMAIAMPGCVRSISPCSASALTLT